MTKKSERSWPSASRSSRCFSGRRYLDSGSMSGGMPCWEGILKVGPGLEESSSEPGVGLHPRKMEPLKRTISTEKTFCFISEILPPGENFFLTSGVPRLAVLLGTCTLRRVYQGWKNPVKDGSSGIRFQPAGRFDRKSPRPRTPYCCGGTCRLGVKDLLLSHPGVGNGKQQSLLDSGPNLIDIDTAGDIVIGGLPPDL